MEKKGFFDLSQERSKMKGSQMRRSQDDLEMGEKERRDLEKVQSKQVS
jgi:hypothetical protein